MDLSGLSDRTIAQRLHAGRLATHLCENEATHLLLPVFSFPVGPGSLLDRLGLREAPQLRLTAVATYGVPWRIWHRQFRFTGSAFRYLLLYRVAPDC